MNRAGIIMAALLLAGCAGNGQNSPERIAAKEAQVDAGLEAFALGCLDTVPGFEGAEAAWRDAGVHITPPNIFYLSHDVAGLLNEKDCTVVMPGLVSRPAASRLPSMLEGRGIDVEVVRSPPDSVVATLTERVKFFAEATFDNRPFVIAVTDTGPRERQSFTFIVVREL